MFFNLSYDGLNLSQSILDLIEHRINGNKLNIIRYQITSKSISSFFFVPIDSN